MYVNRRPELQVYVNRRPKTLTGKITEDLISHHAKESRKKLEGGKRMKHRKLADDTSAVSSIHSNVTRALRVRMPTKPNTYNSAKQTVITAPPKPPAEATSDFGVPMGMPSSSIEIAEPPSRLKRKTATQASAALKTSKRQSSTPSVTVSEESIESVQNCPSTASSSSATSRNKRRQIIKQTQIQNRSIISAIKTAAAQSQHDETDFTVGPCSPAQSYPTQYYILPNYEGPEASMTVGEAERFYESDSD